ncbi:response regulator transcription factor [Ramlibacter sp.]|uniref:response regulator transcription factor n=1 Tax=Ramlibacter sp. TaxID=1917967 RepID=UPI003D09E505
MPSALVIDDDPPQRAMAVYTLRKAGYNVHEAGDGESGLAKVRELRPDAVVCDVMMPRMNGYQVVAAIRKDASIASTLVIMLTSMGERGQVRLGMTSGADDYLVKPCKQHELLEAIEAAANRRHAQQSAVLQTLRDEGELAPEAKVAGPQLHYRAATLLLANLFEALPNGAVGRGASPEQAARVLESARDTLFLFGATQVLPYGRDLLAIFSAERDDHSVRAAARAARAAFKLESSMERALHMRSGAGGVGLTVALHCGDLSLVRMQDVLHGDAGMAPVPSPPLHFACMLRDFAQSQGWRVAATVSALADVPPDVAVVAQRAALAERHVAELHAPPPFARSG